MMAFSDFADMVRAQPCPKLRSHVRYGHLHAYLRVTSRWVVVHERAEIVHTIDLASVAVMAEFMRTGICRAFLVELETLARETGRSVYVESVGNPDFLEFLQRQGYVDVGCSNLIKLRP